MTTKLSSLVVALSLNGCCLSVVTGATNGSGSLVTTSGTGPTGGTSSGGSLDLFYPPVNYPVAKPHAITTFQQDAGALGLATADYFYEYTGDGLGNGQVSLLIGTGSGTFQSAVEIGTPGSAWDGICAGDFYGSGPAELAVGSGNAGTPIGIFVDVDQGAGGSFSGGDLSMPRIHQLACGSIYGSAYLDLVVSSNDGTFVGQSSGPAGFTWRGPYGPTDPRASVVANLGYTELSQIAVADPDNDQIVILGVELSDGGFETVGCSGKTMGPLARRSTLRPTRARSGPSPGTSTATARWTWQCRTG